MGTMIGTLVAASLLQFAQATDTFPANDPDANKMYPRGFYKIKKDNHFSSFKNPADPYGSPTPIDKRTVVHVTWCGRHYADGFMVRAHIDSPQIGWITVAQSAGFKKYEFITPLSHEDSDSD